VTGDGPVLQIVEDDLRHASDYYRRHGAGKRAQLSSVDG
jgi:hypothetical protein